MSARDGVQAVCSCVVQGEKVVELSFQVLNEAHYGVEADTKGPRPECGRLAVQRGQRENTEEMDRLVFRMAYKVMHTKVACRASCVIGVTKHQGFDQ